MQAVVIGAGGGIGAALVAALAADPRYARVHALSRAGSGDAAAEPSISAGTIDITDAASIAAAADAIVPPIDLLIVATGMLHEPGAMPERSLRELDADRLAQAFRINTIGPALAIAAFARHLPRDRRCVIACLSARVGSISDNHLGGWYGYRAAKAALNQIVRTAAIELARSHRGSICVGLHPGTVATPLSAPFRAHLPAGQLRSADDAAGDLLRMLDTLTPAQTGRLFGYDGVEIAP